MSKRSQDESEQESKRVCEEKTSTTGEDLQGFFDGEKPDDVFIIVKRDYSTAEPVLDVYLETEKAAKEILEAIGWRDKRDAKKYEIQRLRKLTPEKVWLLLGYVNKTELK